MTGPLVGSFLERLGRRVAQRRTVLCLGIDPDPATFPAGFEATPAGAEAFGRLLLEAAGPFAVAVKVNLAFFEAWGSPGLAALERLRGLVPAGLPFIADAKRGDIGSTSAMHARALFDRLDADAVTVSPYLGADAIGPLLERPERLVYLLCRTSNPGAGEIQGLSVAAQADGSAPEEPLALRVARLAAGWERHPGTVGLVVGATAPAELEAIRRVAPALPFLVPGVGSQGGEVEPALRHGPALATPAGGQPAGGLLVNVSRGIASSALGASDPGEALAAGARAWAARLEVLA